MTDLHGVERSLNRRSVDELIRLLRSGRFETLTNEQIRAVGEYGAIELEGESFFARAFSTGKEVASSLALARELGVRRVLSDLLALRASMIGRNPGEGEVA
jgi:hypothetical protein